MSRNPTLLHDPPQQELKSETKVEAIVRMEEKAEEVDKSESNTLFVGNLSWQVKKRQLTETFSKYGTVSNCKVVSYFDQTRKRKNSKGYAFVQYLTEEGAWKALKALNGVKFAERELIIKFSTSKGPKRRKGRIKRQEEIEQKGEIPEEAEAEGGTKGEGQPRRRRQRGRKTDSGDWKKNEEEEQPPKDFQTLFVKSLPYNVTKDQVTEVFKEFGPVKMLRIIKRSSKKNPNSFYSMAFCTFHTHALAKKIYDSCIKGNTILKLDGKELDVQVSVKQPADFEIKPGESKDSKFEEEPQETNSSRGPVVSKSQRYRRLWVSGLSENTTDASLKKKFDTFGSVTRCSVRVRKNPNNPLRFAYLDFQSSAAASAAVKEANGIDFEGAKIIVEFAKGRQPRRLGRKNQVLKLE